MAAPTFVIGRDRSGTKWLSNIIASHKSVACVQHKDHFGILEASDILGTAPIIFGDLRIPENFIAFLECFSQSDFFRMTGLDKDYFYKSRPTDHLSFFREMMDRFADTTGKKTWVQKSDVISFKTLYGYFPDGKFIIIIRNLKDTLRSKIGQRLLEGKPLRKHLLKGSVRHFTDMAHISKYSKMNNVYIVQYEDLRKNRRSVAENLCKFLNLEFDEAMLHDAFGRNTSFQRGVSRDNMLTPFDVFTLNVLSLFLKYLPLWAYEYFLSRRKQKVNKQRLQQHEKRLFSLKLRKKELGWE